MANEVQKAQYALMAALNPEQFIEMAIQQGFTPQEMMQGMPTFRGASGEAIPPAQSANLTPPTPGPPAINLFDPVPPAWLPQPTPDPWSGVPPQVGPQAGGPVPVSPAMGNPGEVGAAARGAQPAPMGLPSVVLPNKMPDILEMAAGGLGGLAAKYLEPGAVDPMHRPPVANQIPAMGNPGEVSAAAVPGVPPRPVQPPPSMQPVMVNPPNGILTDPSVMAMAPDPSANAGLVPQTGVDPLTAAMGLAGTIFPPLGDLGPPPAAAAPPPGAPGAPAVTPTPSFSMAMFGGQPTVSTPPPPPPPVSAGLKPVSHAGVDTTSASKPTVASGSPKDTKKEDDPFDMLSKVGSITRGSGGGAGGRPSSAGVSRGQIQAGEITELLAKLLQPAQYTPGFIPYGKLF